MKVEYRNQLPGRGPKTTTIEGWVAWIIGVLIAAAVIAFVIFVILPLALFGIVLFLALIVFAMIGGWVWLGLKIGWRNLWEFTKLGFSIMFGKGTSVSRTERMKKTWKDYTKGRSGEWR